MKTDTHKFNNIKKRYSGGSYDVYNGDEEREKLSFKTETVGVVQGRDAGASVTMFVNNTEAEQRYGGGEHFIIPSNVEFFIKPYAGHNDSVVEVLFINNDDQTS